MAHVPVPVLRMPDIHSLIDAEYDPYDVGVMGEFDVQMLTELFGGEEVADALTPEWNGGIYYAAQSKQATTASEKESTASLALLYLSRWARTQARRGHLRIVRAEIAAEI